ncbi:class I SAM-dependent methyltransferase [Acinetobacter equi]|uniref:SAM-dependent methyltransferase n=1 Tax=Acinetobacter equi TaxID=1324350 RepID=A0A0N9W1R3_9GAMM|nr:class I SAM-dependent methyltransferase [Acinetobacter equi]ALH94964.1 SAM-dependent methyltransferase [Acinetobacter equi]
MKDLFSDHSQLYQSARPSYPQKVLEEILKHVKGRKFAWDCGAGSGQFTQLLSPSFENVVATDLSEQQLQQAPSFENVEYSVQKAEMTNFKDDSFDLITVAQAIHWFNFDLFYKEVRRTLKKDGVIAVIGYGLLRVDDIEVNNAVQKLYLETLDGYWDAERRYIDENYQTIPFPFKEVETAQLKMSYQWSASQLLDYLNTWSAVKYYRQKNENDLFDQLKQLLTEKGDVLFQVNFPILLRVGCLEDH